MAEDAVLPEPDRVDGFPHPREALALFGQDQAEQAFLESWANGRLHHAWLLCGPEGVGKATLAYRIARTLIAQPADTGAGLFGDGPGIPSSLSAPGDCPVQARILAQAEPGLFVLRRSPNPDTGRMRTQIAVDDVRRLRRFLGLSAADGGWRAVIIDAVDEMNRSSANALLKLLEEPPPRTLFLLVCHAPAGLLATIRSRCRNLDLSPLSADALSRALEQAGASVPVGSEEALAQLGGGSAGAALRLLVNDGLTLYQNLIALMQKGQGVERTAMTRLADASAGRQNAERYATTLSLIQMMVARMARTAATYEAQPEAAPGEHALLQAAASSPLQAAAWAECLSTISSTTRHAVAVNLDPAQCVIDTLLEVDTTLGRVRALAA